MTAQTIYSNCNVERNSNTGCFFNSSSQSSVVKMKMGYIQPEQLLYKIFNFQFVCWFLFCAKDGEEQLKKTQPATKVDVGIWGHVLPRRCVTSEPLVRSILPPIPSSHGFQLILVTISIVINVVKHNL